MSNFDYWNEQFNRFFSSATPPNKNNTINFNILKNKILIIQGEKNSGKSTVAEKLLDFYRTEKQVEEITKIYGSKYQYIVLSKNGEVKETFLSNRISTGINKIDVTLSVWEKFLQYKNKRKQYITWIDDFENLNAANSHEFLKILNENSNILPIITVSDERLVQTIIDNLKNRELISLKIPKISYIDLCNYKKKKSIISRKKKSKIFEQLSALNDEKAKLLITMTNGNYGTLLHLIHLLNNKTNFNEMDSLESILNQLFLVEDQSKSDTNRLILYFYMFNQYINFDILERFYADSSFDYISVLEKLEKANILETNDEQFKLKPEICSFGNEYIDNYSNKRLRRNTSFLIDHLIRETNSEDYRFRAENAKYYCKNLANTYLFLTALRNNERNNVELKDTHNSLLKLMNTELNNEEKLTDEKNDVIILDKINELKRNHSKNTHILEKAEYHYFYCTLLLNFSYKKRVDRFSKLKTELIKLLDIYKRIKKENETEMQVKIGLLLSTQLVNVLNKEFLKESIKIYNDIQSIIEEKEHQKNGFYDAYAIKLKLFSSCLLSPEESFEELEHLLLNLKNNVYSYSINQNDLITLTLTNLIGVSFYLTKDDLAESLVKYKEEKNRTKNFSEKRYKLENNIYLANYILKKSPNKSFTENAIKKFLSIKNESHIVQINLAGLYFYMEQYDSAKEILTNILNEEPNDDFYTYFCQYNLILIQLFSTSISSIERNSCIKELKSLKVPALFLTKDTQNAFEKKTKHLIEFIRVNKNIYDPKTVETELINLFEEQVPILQKVWQFSDYQYWS